MIDLTEFAGKPYNGPRVKEWARLYIDEARHEQLPLSRVDLNRGQYDCRVSRIDLLGAKLSGRTTNNTIFIGSNDLAHARPAIHPSNEPYLFCSFQVCIRPDYFAEASGLIFPFTPRSVGAKLLQHMGVEFDGRYIGDIGPWTGKLPLIPNRKRAKVDLDEVRRWYPNA